MNELPDHDKFAPLTDQDRGRRGTPRQRLWRAGFAYPGRCAGAAVLLSEVWEVLQFVDLSRCDR